jgi:hypothetical protein
MSNRVEIFVAIIDKVGEPVFQAGAAAAIHDQFNTEQQDFSLVVQGAQTTTAVAAVLSITRMTAGSVPFINIVTNTLAGTVTFLKIVAEYKPGAEPKHGDYVSLVGNVAGVVAGFFLLAGAPLTASAFAVASMGATIFGAYNSELAQKIYQNAIMPIIDTLRSYDITQEPKAPLIAPNLAIMDQDSISSQFGGLIKVITWHPETMEFQLDTRALGSFKTSHDNQSIIFNEYNPPITTPLSPTNSESTTTTPAVQVIIDAINPTIESPPPPPTNEGSATMTLSIESIGGQTPAGPTPSLTTVVNEGQDNYACSSAPQQDTYR